MRRLLPIGAFVGAYMLAGGVWAASAGNREFVFYGLVMLVQVGVILWIDRRVRLSMPLMWALAAWGLLHMAGGLVPIPEHFLASSPPATAGARNVLYNFRAHALLPRYDQAVHAYGFAVAALLCWEGLRGAVGPVAGGGALRCTAGPAVLAAAASMGLGALNEVVEFIAVLTIPNTNVGGYENTGWDLVSNGVGASAMAAWLWRRDRM